MALCVATALTATAACVPSTSGTRPTDTASPRSSTSPATSTATRTAAAHPLHGAVIVVDPGHNGGNAAHPERINELVDAGGLRKPCNTVGAQSRSGSPEHALNWAIAKRLARLLRAEGARTVLTRKNDRGVGPCVNQRGKLAARRHADLLVSLHADGSAPDAHGFTVLRPTKVRGHTAATFRDSRTLATDIADSLAAGGFTRSNYLGRNGIEARNDLGTLNLAGCPAVMVEMGNMRNAEDVAALRSAKGQQRIARSLTAGVVRYLGDS